MQHLSFEAHACKRFMISSILFLGLTSNVFFSHHLNSPTIGTTQTLPEALSNSTLRPHNSTLRPQLARIQQFNIEPTARQTLAEALSKDLSLPLPLPLPLSKIVIDYNSTFKSTKLATLDSKAGGELDRLAGCFSRTCVVIQYTEFGRSGNRISQIEMTAQILKQCSGIAILGSMVTEIDPVVTFPVVQFYGTPTCNITADTMEDLESMMHFFTTCIHVPFEWRGSFVPETIERCRARAHLEKADFTELHMAKRLLPLWMMVNLPAWNETLDHETAVMHFRGGDIFLSEERRSVHPYYTQAVCAHFVAAFEHSKAREAILVAEDQANPCVNEVKRILDKRARIKQ